MDDLTFRRLLYSDPRTNDPEVIDAAASNFKKQAFREELIAFDADIEAALKVDIPENLAEKLLLRQSIDIETREEAKKPWYWAMAASVALAAVLSFALVTPNAGKLTYDALAHVSHAKTEVEKYGPLDMQTVNAKLANYNGELSNGLGEILSANFCYLDKIKSLHLIVQGKQGIMNLFVLPEEGTGPVEDTFNNKDYSGISFLLESTRVIVVGESESEIRSFSQVAKDKLSFSA